MAGRRLSMRKIKEVLRLNWQNGCSNKQIAQSCNIARSTVREYLKRAQEAGLTWPLDPVLDDTALENLLFPVREANSSSRRQMPSMEYLFRELKRPKVTLQLLWYEYKQTNPEGYQYSQFSNLYRQWVKRLDVTLRQEHRAGQKLFVDYAGQTVSIVNPNTGEISQAHLFVAVLGASNYTYAEATLAEDLPCWIRAHIHAFATYLDLAQHYRTTVIPTRPGRPRDKAKAESAVLVAERWILAALRNHTFFGLAELNRAISEKLTILNGRKFKKLDSTRKKLYETIDKPALRPPPPGPYEYAEWKKARVNIDYHIQIDRHYYSVPYQLTRNQVDVRLTSCSVEVLFKNRRVASHRRSYHQAGFTTLREHMPKSHQRYLDWTPSRIIRWASRNGPKTQDLVTHIMESRPHPEQGFRSSLGIMRLAKRYSSERLERACTRALAIKAYSYRSVESILKNGLDQKPLLPDESEDQGSATHHNIRGKHYYRQKEASHAQ